MKKPNLFSFATSELSQDAFICWLVSWADESYKELNLEMYTLGQAFIELLFEESLQKPKSITKIKVYRQFEQIDVLVEVNDEYVILIEDKKDTQVHSNQLERYLEILKKQYTNRKHVPVYYKMLEQSNVSEMKRLQYNLITRDKMINLLVEHLVHPLVVDYYEYLLEIEHQVNSFKTAPLTTWTRYSWYGFYTYLQTVGIRGEWDYVSNARGGFMGFWWYFHQVQDLEIYLQIEEHKLCIKIYVKDRQQQSELREKWSKYILEKAVEQQIQLERPKRFGKGTYMTIAQVADDFRKVNKQGQLDLVETMHVLNQVQHFLKKII